MMGKALVIRKMVSEDVQQAAAIEKENFSEPWGEQDFLDALALDHTLYIAAEEDDKVIGYCGCYVSFDEAEIVNVAVAGSHRRRGIGRELLKFLFSEGETKGISSYFLEVRMGNVPAIGLYRDLGFEDIGVRKGFYRFPTEDALIMKKS